MASHIVGYPRMGPKRELKIAQSFGDWESSAGDFQKLAADLGVEYVIDPEWVPPVKFSYASHKAVTEYKEAKALGVDTVPVLGKDKLVVSTSCSLLHTAVDLVNETKLDKEIKPWLALAVPKVVEINALARALGGQKDKVIFYANAAAQASRKSSPRGQRCGVPKLFGIEETKGDRDLINNTEEEIGISSPANNRSPRPMMVKISRSSRPKTMRVKITVNSREYIALIDTGSTYNLLQPRVAGEMGLNIIRDDPIEVRIADGSIMRSEGSCPEFKFEIQGVQFATEAYILQLGGFDVILGIEWLGGLGPIKNWDFASLKMELTQGDRTIQIKGMDTEESEEGSNMVFREGVKYGAGIGPGVYDIHSPRVPSTEEIADRINKMLAVLETIQVNPDCGQPRRLAMIPAC